MCCSVLLQFDRPAEERAAQPRSSPLSHDLGAIVAGVAGSPSDSSAAGLHTLAEDADVVSLQERFPAVSSPYELQS